MLMRWLCAVLVLFVGGLFAYVAFSVKVAQRRAVLALATLACPGCGKVFGAEVAEKLRLEAHAAVQQRLAEARARGVLLRLDGKWRFGCPACGNRLVFDPGKGTLEADALPPGSTGPPASS